MSGKYSYDKLGIQYLLRQKKKYKVTDWIFLDVFSVSMQHRS